VRALVISHDPTEQPAVVGATLELRGYDLDVFVVCDSPADPVSERPFPCLDGVDAVVVMGAPWSVYDSTTIGSWIARELAFVREVHERGVPYLGICFGGQVLAAALGGQVEPAPRAELGWCCVDPLVPAAVAAGPWFQWHGDRFTLPPGAVELARNDVGVQAFCTGRSVGVQFHPEVDHALLASWLRDGEPPDPLFAQLGVDPETVLAEAAEVEATTSRHSAELVDWWLSLSTVR
jgi:GMP synthase-like glutamine amidotransferase